MTATGHGTAAQGQTIPAATVILLDSQGTPGEPFAVFLLRRRAASAFMPNRYVFPGGKVEPGDGTDPLDPMALRRAALRELWEEAGIVLAKPQKRVVEVPAAELHALRAALQQGTQSLQQALAGLALRPDLDALLPFAHWVTPQARTRRFDTHFFLARLPAGQQAACDQSETTGGLWLGPAEALARNQAGRVSLAPPQVRLLGELSQWGSLEAAWHQAAMRSPRPVRPKLWQGKDRRMVLLPWDPDYGPGQPRSPARPCPAAEATRLVHANGLWLPWRAR